MKKHQAKGELFDEAEDTVDEAEQVEPEELVSSTETSLKKKSVSRKPLPAQLPRIRNVIELPEDECVCPCGCQLTEIGEDVSEQSIDIATTTRVSADISAPTLSVYRAV